MVLGNEGHGIRTNILNRCHKLVSIPKGISNSNNLIASSIDSVDSLNVSVCGGIILHQILTRMRVLKSNIS